ncbi:MAG: SufS family cysteine desulfurase [Candidatus Omnitrophica bacterium]|nr:SufS family cysteine desulfurase [Candidatus Omnitrophota bacterium]
MKTVAAVRKDFPMLEAVMNGRPLVYLDNAASTQKPVQVLERMDRFYRNEYANVHRGVYRLSHDATAACEAVRELCRLLLGAASEREIVFVRGATEAVNLVASTYAADRAKPGMSVVITETEHHANLVPWQALCERTGMSLKVIPVDDAGALLMDAASRLIDSGTLLVAAGHVSNVLGVTHEVRALARLAHAAGAVMLVDGAQAVPHQPVDVRELECDFYCLSSHKVYGPTGVGVLYGRLELLEGMRPYQYGGDMIESVSFKKTTYARAPQRFEAGTPPFAEIIGLGAAIEYLNALGWDWIAAQEQKLFAHASAALAAIPGLKIYGSGPHRASLISFTLGEVHPHDIGTVLDEAGIAVRAGHHCAQPTMTRFGVPAMVRASFSFYNTLEEANQLAEAVKTARRIFA